MGAVVLLVGRSGSGKTASLRNFDGSEVGVLNVLGKPMPFRNVGEHCIKTMDHAGYHTITEMLVSGRRKSWVVDDAGYLMANENFDRAAEGGYDKFTEMAVNFRNLMKAATLAPSDTITYVVMHTELDQSGHEKPKTIGKMVDEKYCIEGACIAVIECVIRDGKHVFVTKNDGYNLAKAPMGSLPDVMPNDLKAVDRALREYWGMTPNESGNTEKETTNA